MELIPGANAQGNRGRRITVSKTRDSPIDPDKTSLLRFPKTLVVRVAPGATVPVGCTYNYRSGTGPSSPTFVQVVVTKIGASYVNPSSPNHPSEDGTPFTAFLLLQGGLPGCDSGSKPQGALLILNLHPYARLSVVVSLSGDGGSKFDLAPASFLRAGCSNGPNSPTGSSNAKLVYPAGQKKQP